MFEKIKKELSKEKTARINYIVNGKIFYQSKVKYKKWLGFVRYANHIKRTRALLSVKYCIPEKSIHACNTI